MKELKQRGIFINGRDKEQSDLDKQDAFFLKKFLCLKLNFETGHAHSRTQQN